MTDSLVECDVLAYRVMQAGGPISRLVNNVIAQFTSSVYFHVEIYIGDGWSVTAGKHGIEFSDSIMHTSNFDAFRLKRPLIEPESDAIELNAYKQVGKPYDYFATLLMPFASPAAVARRSANEAWMCSELTAWCYRRAGIDLVPYFTQSAAIAPVDVARSELLEYVGSWYRGNAVTDAEPHKLNRFQKKPGRFSVLLTNRFVKRRSLKDEFYEQLKRTHEGKLQDSDGI